MSPGIATHHFRRMKNVGGTATWPSTSRLRAAYSSAYAAAYDDPHKQAVSVLIDRGRPKPRLWKNGQQSFDKESLYARAFFD